MCANYMPALSPSEGQSRNINRLELPELVILRHLESEDLRDRRKLKLMRCSILIMVDRRNLRLLLYILRKVDLLKLMPTDVVMSYLVVYWEKALSSSRTMSRKTVWSHREALTQTIVDPSGIIESRPPLPSRDISFIIREYKRLTVQAIEIKQQPSLPISSPSPIARSSDVVILSTEVAIP